MTTSHIWTWLITYAVINGFVAVGFLLLARFLRKKAPLTDGREQERARKQGLVALGSLGIAFLFGGKFLWALVSGQNLEAHRRTSWRWVTKDSDPNSYWLCTVVDGGFAVICLVGFVCFLVIRSLESSQHLDPVQRMDAKLKWVFTLFWTFVLTMEFCIFLGYDVLRQ